MLMLASLRSDSGRHDRNTWTISSEYAGVNYAKGVYVYTGVMTSVSPYVSYVCTDCGYFENYIDDRAKLADVASKWERVGAPE
jgi:hypothetical protein